MASVPPITKMNRRPVGLLACTALGLMLASGEAGAQHLGELRGSMAGEASTPARAAIRYDTVTEPRPGGVAALDPFPEPVTSTLDVDAPASGGIGGEEADDTANERASRLNGTDNERGPRDNIRTGAIGGLDSRLEEDAFAPLGIRTGSFLLTPTLEQGITWSSNASSSPGGGKALISETALRLNAISDWSRHRLALQGDGTLRKTISGEQIEELEGGARGELTLDLGSGFEALASLSYRARPESASSPFTIEGAASRPLRQTFAATAGIAGEMGRLRIGITGDVTRDIYGDAELTDGSILSQGGRDTTLATVALRAGYEISPALRPFVEGEFGRRLYDEEVDPLGYVRSADRYGLRAGLEFDLGEKFGGEVSAGWLTERPDDDRLDAIAAPTIAANVRWSPLRGTVVELNGTTTVESTTQTVSAGSLLYAGSLAVTRDLRANLTGRALVGLDWRDYTGSSEHEMIMRGEASLTWWMNRYAGITTRARHEIQRSSLSDRDYDATSLYLGMTLQR